MKLFIILAVMALAFTTATARYTAKFKFNGAGCNNTEVKLIAKLLGETSSYAAIISDVLFDAPTALLDGPGISARLLAATTMLLCKEDGRKNASSK